MQPAKFGNSMNYLRRYFNSPYLKVPGRTQVDPRRPSSSTISKCNISAHLNQILSRAYFKEGIDDICNPNQAHDSFDGHGNQEQDSLFYEEFTTGQF